MLYNANMKIERAYQLTLTKPAGLLVFMLSDLDRLYEPEKMHSVPIAFRLKGYSLPTGIFRLMIEKVLNECTKAWLFVPVCCFDGQWCRLAARDPNENPSTVLQVQRDVYNEAKKRSKNDFEKQIYESNIIAAKTHEDLKMNGYTDPKKT